MQDPFAVASAIQRLVRRQPQVSLSEAALELRVSRRSIESACRARLGLSFRELRGITRFQLAYALLRTRTDSVKGIAYALGYGSPQAFSRFVRAMCGLSPTDIRAAENDSEVSSHAAKLKGRAIQVDPRILLKVQ